MEHASRLMCEPPPGGVTDIDKIIQWDPPAPDRKRFGIRTIGDYVWQTVNVTASPLVRGPAGALGWGHYVRPKLRMQEGAIG